MANQKDNAWQIMREEVQKAESPTFYLRKKIICRLIRKYTQTDQDVLDVGCGNGVYSIYMAKIGLNIDCFDVSEKAISILKDKIKKDKLKINFEINNVENFKSKKNYNLIIISEVLEHLSNDFFTIKKFRKMLKLDGYILFSVPFNPKLWSLADEISFHKRRYTLKRLNALLFKNSLKPVKIIYYGFPILTSIMTLKLIFNKRIVKTLRNISNNKSSKLLINIISKLLRIILFIDYFFSKFIKHGIGAIVLAKKE